MENSDNSKRLYSLCDFYKYVIDFTCPNSGPWDNILHCIYGLHPIVDGIVDDSITIYIALPNEQYYDLMASHSNNKTSFTLPLEPLFFCLLRDYFYPPLNKKIDLFCSWDFDTFESVDGVNCLSYYDFNHASQIFNAKLVGNINVKSIDEPYRISFIRNGEDAEYCGMIDFNDDDIESANGYGIFFDNIECSAALAIFRNGEMEEILPDELEWIMPKMWRMQSAEFYKTRVYVGDITSEASHEQNPHLSTSRYGIAILENGMYIGEFPAGKKMKQVIGKYFDLSGNIYEGKFKLPIYEEPNWNDVDGGIFPF